MAKRMLIDAAHPEETRVVVLSGHRLDEFDFETSTKKQIKGNIYLAKVTRVEPSLQAAFVEYGGNRHGFLAFNEIHPDYYRIPVSDRRPWHDHGHAGPGESAASDAAPADHAPVPTADETDESPDDPQSGDPLTSESPTEHTIAAEARDGDIVYGSPEPGPVSEPEYAPDAAAEPHAPPQDREVDSGDHGNRRAEHPDPTDSVEQIGREDRKSVV